MGFTGDDFLVEGERERMRLGAASWIGEFCRLLAK